MKSRAPLVCLVVLAVLSSLATARAQDPVAPDSVARLVDLWGLPLLTPGVTCKQFASTDLTGNGDDHGHFLRLEGNRAVLAEMNGPGVIARLWSANADGRLRVFCDGEAEPRIDGPFQDLFTGKLPPFVEPLAIHQGGGWISYFPIPYAKSCRVEVTELKNPGALYYQVQYLTYPQGTPMRTFTRELPASEREALQRVLQFWKQPGESPVPAGPGEHQPKVAVTVPRGETRELFQIAEPGTVLTLRLGLQQPTPATLRGLLLAIEWDGNPPSVQAPVGDFFGVGFGNVKYRGLVLGFDERGGYCHFAMPFRKSARLTLHNATTADQAITAELRWRSGAPSAAAGAFHAEYRVVDGVGKNLYEIAAIQGPGKYVGITQALQGVGDLWYLEGNEEFTVDSEGTPAIRGTGTEDFYNGGWYWDSGPFALPLHGLGVKEEWTTNRTTPWRLQVPDAVPFATKFVARIEHGSSNAVLDSCYSSVAYWYGPPIAARAVPDAELRLPRLWVFRPKGVLGAAELHWNADPAVEWRTWEELTPTHRGLDHPLFQAFPVSYVERDQPAIDARVAVFPGGSAERVYRAHLTAPFGDRFGMQLRLAVGDALPRLLLDGVELPLPKPLPLAQGPLQIFDLGATALTAGQHELAFAVPPGSGRPTGLDSLRLVPASPYVRTWRVCPPIDAKPGGTVEDAMPDEAQFLAADFDPAKAGWKAVHADGDGLDLNQAVSSKAPMLAYLFVFVNAPTARTAHVLLGSDDGARVWVNSKLAWSHHIHRPMAPDADQFDVPLAAGWNRVLVKVKNDDGGYGVMLRIADPDGTLRFATDPR